MKNQASILLPLPELITVNTLCKTLDKGCATNRFKNSIFPSKCCFGILLPFSFDDHAFSVRGAITWGASGLNFQITPTSAQRTKTTWSAHKRDFDLSIEDTETLILEFLQCAKDKLIKQQFNPGAFGRGKFPRIEAHKRDSQKVYTKSESNLIKCYEAKIFSLEFKNFVKANLKNKIICSGEPK